MDRTTDSIVVTIKKMLGLDDGYTPFDADVIVHINTAIMTLTQMGVGPKEGYEVLDYDQTWTDFLGGDMVKMLGAVKTYIYLQVKMVFDPPNNSFVMDAYKQQCEQLLFRLNVNAESQQKMDFMRKEGLKRGANPKNIPDEETPVEETPSEDSPEENNGDGGGNWQSAEGGFDVEIIGGGS